MAIAIDSLQDTPPRAFSQPAPYVDRNPSMLGNTVTPERLTSLLEARNSGDLQAWADFACEMRRNVPHLHSQLAIREESVVETPLRVVPGDESPAALAAAAECDRLLARWRRVGLEEWVAQMVAAVFHGRSAHEVIWQPTTDGLIAPVALEHIDQRRLSLACDPDDPDPWALRLWDRDDWWRRRRAERYGTKLADYGPDKVLVHEPRVLGGVKTTEGLFSSVVWYCTFAVWTWRDLMALNEMLGRPPVVAYYAAGGARAGRENEFGTQRQATADEVDVARATVFGISGSLRSVLPDTVRLEALEFAIPTSTPVQLLTEERCNALISKAVNGVANLSDLQPGARAAVEAQERTSYTFWRADCRRVERLLSELFARFVRANPTRFGADCPLPCARLETDPPRDRASLLAAIELAQKVGIVVPEAWARGELGIPAPETDTQGEPEPVLVPPAATPAPAPLEPDETDETDDEGDDPPEPPA